MDTLQSILTAKATRAIDEAFGDVLSEYESIAEVAPCQQENFGHYQCNSAMKIAKILKKNPRDIAQIIIDFIDPLSVEGDLMIVKMDIAGPGFINIHIGPTFLSKDLNHALNSEHLGVSLAPCPKRVIVEFSSPNIAKELHVGHLRSTIIGDCIARVFEFMGHDVLRLNHIGDWGTQFGMLINYLKKYQPRIITGDKESDLSELTNWYKDAKKHFDEDEEFKKESQLEVVNLQGGQEEALLVWKIICDISRKAFEEIYGLLDVKIVERGESFYNPELPKIVEDLEKKNVITVSDGAKCIFLEGYKNREGNPLPVMVQKSDGGYNYDTTDIAGFKQRIEDEKADRIIIVTDAGQSLHFKMIYDAVVKANYLDPKKVRFDHVPFGLVLGPDGKKFKTRSGETEKLIDLLSTAVTKASEILKEKMEGISDEEAINLGKILGIDAIKYADLSSHRVKDYVFSYDKMLKFEGNTAAFLLYAYVRIQGIKRKKNIDINELIQHTHIELEHPSEVTLGLHLRRFGEILEAVEQELLPNRLSDYLYTLAEKYNAFFRDCRVVGDEKESQRLALSELTGRILKKGLELLGLQVMDRM
ncbi:MAG TPA: arginine--tRNA ligase [Chlamydiales bacterium]|nr:arginine--tRNA ligase [Chlamydiales bacterium]